VLISVDRYVAICDPLHYPTRVTERRVKLCVCLCWLCSVVSFIVPVIVIVVLYMRVFVVAVSQARAMRSHVTAVTLQLSVSQTTRKSELKAARTLGVLVVVFLICFIPYYCVSLAGEDLLSGSYAYYVLFLFYFNSTLNPVIYALFYPWFRKAVQLVVTLQILQPGSCEANIL